MTELADDGLPPLREALDAIAAATKRLQAYDQAGPLRVSVLTSFAARWLLPRLTRFRDLHPEIDVVTDWQADGKGLPESVQHALYRIGQEMLNNIGKHADATSVEISLRQNEGLLHLTVRDDGRGFHTPERLVDLARQDHFGLLGAVERAEMVGGRLDVVSTPGAGTTVTVAVPLDTPPVL